MSEYAGRIAVGAIVAVALVVGLAFELNSLVPSNTGTLSNTTAIPVTPTEWFGNEAPSGSCGNMTLESETIGHGYKMDMYLPATTAGHLKGISNPAYPLGSDFCIYTYLQNVNNESTSLPVGENITVFSGTIADLTFVYYQSTCAVPTPYSGPFGANSTGWNCSVTWNTSQPYNGVLPNATEFYTVEATVRFSGLPLVINLPDGPIGFSTSPVSTTSSATPEFACGGPTFKPLTPSESGPLSLKVTTDQGAIVDNGTVFVTHLGPKGTANYCLHLQPNSTGYLQIAADDGLAPTGAYNMTVFAGFGQGPGYEGSLPAIDVAAGASVNAILSVPSGAMSIVTSMQGQSVTTTTIATTVDGEG